jgi:hypothetical protein
MSEVTDLVMPVLQHIQADIADVKRVLAEHTELHKEHQQRFEDMEIYLAYATGVEAQNKADVRSVKADIRTIKQRLEALEKRP